MASICYVGDSRTNGLKSAVSGATFIAKDSSGLSWLKSTAYSQVKTWLRSNPSGAVIFNFGVNDLYNIDNYINYYKNTVIAENPNKSIYFMTVNPTDGSHSSLNSSIKSFNSKMASNFPSRIIDTSSNVSFVTTDGLHYNSTTYKAIHNYVQKVISEGATKNSTSLRTKLLQVAQGELGTRETGANECKYNDWYYGRHVSGSAYPWCAVFVSWCAEQAGMLGTFIPKTASCSVGMSWYSNKGWYKTRGSYTPQAGDIIYFGQGSHTGIVKSCDGSTVHTIEGNASNSVKESSYSVTDSYISGYGAYEGAGVAGSISSSDGTASSSLESLMPAITYTTYTAKKGDTLESIAKKYNTTVSMIIYLNNLDISDITNLTGKKLTVPENSNSESVGSIASSQVITKKSTRGVIVTHPYANVSIFTETGLLSITQTLIVKDSTLDLDILSIATNRDMSQDCPTFNVVLSFRREWYEKIASNDLVIIDMCRPPETKRSVFFGLVDDLRKSTDYNSDTPTRTISITGRGFGKAFSRFEIGVISELSAINDALGFMGTSDSAIFQNGAPNELIEKCINFYIGERFNMKFANGKTYNDYFKKIIKGRNDNTELLANPTVYMSYQGTMNNFLKELCNAPFNEFFWEVIDNKPTFIFRPTPFNEPEWTELHRIEIKDMDVIKESLGKSDTETYTIYKVNAETFLGTTDTIYYPLWYPPYYEKYGLSKLEVTSKYLTAGNLLDSSNGNYTSGVQSNTSTLTGTENAEKIWNYLIGKGLSPAGAAGLMGNLEAESGLQPNNLQNTSNSRSGMSDEEFTSAVDNGQISKSEFISSTKFGSTGEYGYGLAQWTSKGRKQGLYELVKSRNVSIADLAAQLDWLYQELSSSYSGVLSVLKSTNSLQQASNKVLIDFEAPASKNSAETQSYRKNLGQAYYDKFANKSGDRGPELRTTQKVKAKFTAYYPADNALEGGFLDALGNRLDPSKNTLAAPPSIPFHTKIKITGTNTSRDGGIYEVLDRGGAIQIEGDTYHFDILMSSNAECNTWGVKYGYAIIGDTNGVDGETDTSSSGGTSSGYTYSSDYVAMENEKEATLARMVDLFNWNILNNAMENGTVIVKGSNQYKIGERVIFESTGIEYYVEAVAHNFTFFQGWTTTLTLTRGIVPNLRYAPPWGKYQEITPQDASKIFGYDVGSCMVATSSNSSYSGTTGNANTSGWGRLGVSCPRYYQSGQSWSNIDYQGGSIGRRGCGLCCLAMAVSGLLKINETPDKVVKLLNDAGVNTVYNAKKCTEIVCNHYGLKWTTVSRTNKSAIDAYLKRGCVIYHSIDANGIYTGGGHFILCVGTNGNGGYYVQESAHYYESDRAYTFSQVFSPGVQGPFVIGTSL